MPLSASSLRGASPPWGRRGGWRRLRGKLAKGFSLPQFSPPSERDLCKFPSCLFKGTLGLPGSLEEPRFACGDRFSLLLLPFIARPVSVPCTSRVPMCVAGPRRGDAKGQGGKGFSLNWEELGVQGREKDTDSRGSEGEPSGLGFRSGRAHKT